MNDILKLEDIEKLMDDTREAAEYQNVRSNEFDLISLIFDSFDFSRKFQIYWLVV